MLFNKQKYDLLNINVFQRRKIYVKSRKAELDSV